MIYVSCPKCGRKLLEGEKGSTVQVKCKKCNCLLHAELQECRIVLTIKPVLTG